MTDPRTIRPNPPTDPDRLGRAVDQPEDPSIDAALRTLFVPAPPTLLPATLVAVGLADGYARVGSPIGPVFVAFNRLGVSAIAVAENGSAFEAWFVREFGRPAHAVDALPTTFARSVARRIAGDRRASVPLDLRGRTPFERAVWEKALQIPRGEVRPYGWIAAEIGRPKAVRAVGSALGRNPVPLVIPCHRVVRTDGHIGQYALGADRKRAVLDAEGVDIDRLESLARVGIRLIGSDTTHIVCLPTCHNARRIRPVHEVPFHSLREAASAGYRPCSECRPTAVAA
jgi:O-6-methylguanine DNA methyltransferase